MYYFISARKDGYHCKQKFANLKKNLFLKGMYGKYGRTYVNLLPCGFIFADKHFLAYRRKMKWVFTHFCGTSILQAPVQFISNLDSGLQRLIIGFWESWSSRLT